MFKHGNWYSSKILKNQGLQADSKTDYKLGLELFTMLGMLMKLRTFIMHNSERHRSIVGLTEQM